MRFMQDFHEFDHTTPFDKVPATKSKKSMETVVGNEMIGKVWLIRYQDRRAEERSVIRRMSKTWLKASEGRENQLQVPPAP